MKFKIQLLYKLFFVLILSVSIFLANAQEATLVRGYMMDESSFDAVPLANILVKNSGARAISNRAGFFRVTILPTDSIFITAIGYNSKLLMGKEIITNNTDDTIRIYMRSTVYKLKDVNVVYSNHKRDSIARLAAEYLKDDPLLNNYDRVLNRAKGNIMSPLTAMYQAWSKEGQDMAHFEEFLQYAEKQKAVDRRLNKKVVKKVTNLPDEDLDAFMLFCRPDKDFVINAPDYDLYEAIKKCADDFNGKKMKERKRLR